MMTFKEFLADRAKQDAPEVVIVKLPGTLLEHEAYKNIPGTKSSYRTDAGNTNTETQQHVHVYAKPKGKGSEMYSLNKGGSGHDGYNGKEIPKPLHFLRAHRGGITIHSSGRLRRRLTPALDLQETMWLSSKTCSINIEPSSTTLMMWKLRKPPLKFLLCMPE